MTLKGKKSAFLQAKKQVSALLFWKEDVSCQIYQKPLTKEQEMLLDDISEQRNIVASVGERETFVKAFKLCARFMIDLFPDEDRES